MHQNNGGRVFGRHLDNQVDKALKDAKDKRNGNNDQIGGKENIINDAAWTKDGLFKMDCPQRVLEYQLEIYEFLYQREQENQGFQLSIHERKINETMRNTTVHIIARNRLGLQSKTLFQTVDLIDQAIQHLNPEAERLELIAITCLFIATKYEEIYPPPLGALLRGTELRVREVIDMEKEILYKLNFNVISDNTLIWLQLIGELLGCNKRYLDLIKQRSMQVIVELIIIFFHYKFYQKLFIIFLNKSIYLLTIDLWINLLFVQINNFIFSIFSLNINIINLNQYSQCVDKIKLNQFLNIYFNQIYHLIMLIEIKQKNQFKYLAELSLSNDRFASIKKSTIALTIYLAVEMQFGYQKTQFQWNRLSQHSKPSKDSKPLRLFTYCLKN